MSDYPHYRARINRLEDENLHLRESVDTLRNLYVQEKATSVTQFIHGVRLAADATLNTSGIVDEKEFPTVTALKIHDAILKMLGESGGLLR